jgi:hypothetical protein
MLWLASCPSVLETNTAQPSSAPEMVGDIGEAASSSSDGDEIYLNFLHFVVS